MPVSFGEPTYLFPGSDGRAPVVSIALAESAEVTRLSTVPRLVGAHPTPSSPIALAGGSQHGDILLAAVAAGGGRSTGLVSARLAAGAAASRQPPVGTGRFDSTGN